MSKQLVRDLYTRLDSDSASVMSILISLMLLLIAARQGVSQLTNAQKQLLLDLHNLARSHVSPTAANMLEMVR